MGKRGAAANEERVTTMVPICEVCYSPFEAEDLEDGVTISADCCGRIGLCSQCREFGIHDCDDPPIPTESTHAK